MSDTELLNWLDDHLARFVKSGMFDTRSCSLRVKRKDGSLDYSIGGGLHGTSLRDALTTNAYRST